MWTRAQLGGIGQLGELGDASLAASCIPSPGDTNGARVVCGGITFANANMALSWPGAAMVQNVPTVNSTLAAPVFPASLRMFGMDSRDAPAATPNEAKRTGKEIGPSTLVAPLPSITPVQPDRVSESDSGAVCEVSRWAVSNPVLAAVAALGVYLVFKGGGR
jgi:hypothetical protein